jgi:hypothetical protein
MNRFSKPNLILFWRFSVNSSYSFILFINRAGAGDISGYAEADLDSGIPGELKD